MKLIKNFDEKIKDKKFFLLIIPSKEQIDFVYWNFLVDVQKEK